MIGIMPKVQVQILTYNSEKYILQCLESVKNQTYKNLEVIVMDNNSKDNTISLINAHYSSIKAFVNNRNEGFCRGHNIGIQQTETDYIIVLNPDVILDKCFIAEAVEVMEKNKEIGIVSGKVLRMKEDFSLTNIIDSTGITISKQRRGFDRGQSIEDIDQFNIYTDVFGASGAAAVFRRAMLEDIKVDNEYFDESFFAYKEDIDLSWRARLKGWECRYCPEAIAYHMRGWNEGNRKSQPLFIRVHSIKNRILMMLKNDSVVGILKHLPQILIYELAVFFYCLLFDFKALRYIIEVVKLLPQTLRKRKLIQSTRRVDDREIYKYFK